MSQFRIKSTIQQYDYTKEFCEAFQIGEGDLIFARKDTYEKYFKAYTGQATIIDFRKYGSGEPNDVMVEQIHSDIENVSYQRVIAIGGGSILDVAKLFALKHISPVQDLFDRKLEMEKVKILVAVPTTCGTGSEVTNISVLELLRKRTKQGLATDELFADYAILIPELLDTLPFQSFATSSIDAFVHAFEAYLSPKANEFTDMFASKAMEMILIGYQRIAVEGEQAKLLVIKDFLMASTYAGIAFGNAGTAAVHALSYPFSGAFHVPHGEANYTIMFGVLRKYASILPEGKLRTLNHLLARNLVCKEEALYEELDELFEIILPRKTLKSYGASRNQLEEFTDSVMKNQGRLMANNYVELSREDVFDIYQSLY